MRLMSTPVALAGFLRERHARVTSHRSRAAALFSNHFGDALEHLLGRRDATAWGVIASHLPALVAEVETLLDTLLDDVGPAPTGRVTVASPTRKCYK